MSLVGNLEDLGLGDILQIVSLSRKSGVLSLRNRGREGRIVFLHGQVIQATSSVFRETLGDLLLRRGLVDLDILKKALYLQRQMPRPVRLGTILSERFNLSREVVEGLLREQIEKIVYSFFGWTEGTFSFELGEPDELAATQFNPLQFMLDQGLNPQWLAMEGSRKVDEGRHRGEGAELHEIAEDVPSSGDKTVPLVAPPPEVPIRGKILLIDDDPLAREQIGRTLTDRGFSVSAFALSGDILEAAELGKTEKVSPLLLIDLIMPRGDGKGMLGGFELLEKVRERIPGARVLIMTDLPSPEAERRTVDLGVPFVLAKPKTRDFDSEEGRRTLEVLADRICRFLHEPSGRSTHFNLGIELFEELGEEPDIEASAAFSPGLHLLKGMLQELNNPSLGGGIILLVLRFASEFMNRAVVFNVKGKEIVGLGQFGIEFPDVQADARVRAMRIPVEEYSPFSAALEGMVPLKMSPAQGRWDIYLQEMLGGGEPGEIFLGPIISEGKTVAVLYGDNLPHKQPIGDTEPLEIFLSQAGVAMEKALLERRLQGISAITSGER